MMSFPDFQRRYARHWCTALPLAMCLLPSHAASLFVNGSFETPLVTYQAPGGGNSTAIPGWTTALSGVEHYNSPAYGLGAAADGVMVVDLAYYTSGHGAIEQALATVAGQRYDVSFFAGNTRSSGRSGSGIVKVTIDGGTTLEFATPDATTALTIWAERSFSFVASDASTTIRFWNDQNPFAHFALIDGVGAQAAVVPEPGSMPLVLAGVLTVGGLMRRRQT